MIKTLFVISRSRPVELGSIVAAALNQIQVIALIVGNQQALVMASVAYNLGGHCQSRHLHMY